MPKGNCNLKVKKYQMLVLPTCDDGQFDIGAENQ
jgi:hypothetical protein